MTEETENNDSQKNAEDKLMKLMEQSINEAYLRGMAAGGKTFVGVIYGILLDDRKQRKNPAMTLEKIQKRCERLLATIAGTDKAEKAGKVIAETVNKSEN